MTKTKGEGLKGTTEVVPSRAGPAAAEAATIFLPYAARLKTRPDTNPEFFSKL
jgi:hypothetical protein